MKNYNLIFALLIGIFLSACSSDDDTPSNPDNPHLNYDYGFFVLNEGSSAGGTVSFVSTDLEEVSHDLFDLENPNEELGLGLFLQSIFFDDTRAFIVSNGSNLISVVDRYSFELLGRIEQGLSVPRYGVIMDGKAYVTNQGDFMSTADDFVAVIDLQSLEVENNISVPGPIEFIEAHEGKLYIQSAAYNMGNQISILNPTTEDVQTISVSEELNSIDIAGNALYALSTSGIEKVNLTDLSVSMLLPFPSGTFPTKLKIENGKIYYSEGKDVFFFPIENPKLPTTPLLTYESNSEFGVMYGFEVEAGRIFIADAGDFASSGSLHIYDSEGVFLKEIEVGIAPNGFYFNN